jgi:hypothetical protein
MFGADAFLLARLADGAPAGLGNRYNLSGVSPSLRPLAERLLAVGPEKWQAIWDEFLAGRCGHASTMQTAAEPGPAPPAAVAAMEPPSPPNLRSPATVTPRQGPAGPEGDVRMTCNVNLKPRAVEWLRTGPRRPSPK